jgi:hypothetical protein
MVEEIIITAMIIINLNNTDKHINRKYEYSEYSAVSRIQIRLNYKN